MYKMVEYSTKYLPENKLRYLMGVGDPIDLIENRKHKHILTFENQLKTIEYFGIKQIIIINFNKELMKMSPKKFIEEYLNRFNIRHLVFG